MTPETVDERATEIGKFRNLYREKVSSLRGAVGSLSLKGGHPLVSGKFLAGLIPGVKPLRPRMRRLNIPV